VFRALEPECVSCDSTLFPLMPNRMSISQDYLSLAHNGRCTPARNPRLVFEVFLFVFLLKNYSLFASTENFSS